MCVYIIFVYIICVCIYTFISILRDPPPDMFKVCNTKNVENIKKFLSLGDTLKCQNIQNKSFKEKVNFVFIYHAILKHNKGNLYLI